MQEKRKIFYIHYDDNQPVVEIMHDLVLPMRFLSYDYILHNVYKKYWIKLSICSRTKTFENTRIMD